MQSGGWLTITSGGPALSISYPDDNLYLNLDYTLTVSLHEQIIHSIYHLQFGCNAGLFETGCLELAVSASGPPVIGLGLPILNPISVPNANILISRITIIRLQNRQHINTKQA